jgi:hypothetical protein
MESTMNSLLICVVIALYLLPGIVAHQRRHNNFLAILMMVIFLGWSFIGWVLALIWACTDNTAKRNI